MREIKFRIWEKSLNKFHYDLDWLFKNPSVLPSKIFNREDNSLIPQQFTGLFDKNGKEIYEGDILTHGKTYPNWICEFNEQMGCFTISGFCINRGEGRYINTRDLEIIGNVFENKDLINYKK